MTTVRFLFVLVMILFSAHLPARDEICLDDDCFPSSKTLGDVSLPIRGAGQLEYWGFDVYKAALYVDDEAQTISEILGETPRILILSYDRRIKRSDIIKATEKALRHQPDADLHILRERLETLYGWYRDVGPDDRYELKYTPGKGTTVMFNNEECGIIEGADFGKALFGIWLSEEPLDEELRDALIGWS